MSRAPGRRKFFAMLGVGGVATAVAALSSSQVKRKAAAEADARRQGGGYRETEHVRSYYRTART